MTPAEFARGRPTISEIEGFKLGMNMLQLTYTTEEMEPLYRYERELLTGKATPAYPKIDPDWVYKRGRKPVRRR